MSAVADTTDTKGVLDVNGNNVADTMEFDQQDAGSTKIEYKSGTQESYATTDWDALVASFGTDPYTEPTTVSYDDDDDSSKPNVEVAAAPVTTTKTSGDATITVSIWLEGWQSVNGKNCWELAKLNKAVSVDMRFECKADQQ